MKNTISTHAVYLQFNVPYALQKESFDIDPWHNLHGRIWRKNNITFIVLKLGNPINRILPQQNNI